jgi:hypothetical protein
MEVICDVGTQPSQPKEAPLMSIGTFRVACRGFGEHEQRLLQQQLKMLRGRTEMEWHYVGDDRAAELTLLRDEDQPASSVVAVFKDGRFTMRHSVEWPLRIFGLYDLLTDCERDLAQHTPAKAPALSIRLSKIVSATYYDHEGLSFVILPHEDSLYCDIDDFETLVERMAALPEDLTAAPLNSAPGKQTLQHAYSLKRIIWALCLAEPAPIDQLEGAEATEYRIAAWPDYGEWKSTPALLRLAALYSRQYATVAEGVEFARASAEDVVAFLNACERCALGVSARNGRPKPTASVRPTEKTQEGLLLRLRKRLGMAFGKSNQT